MKTIVVVILAFVLAAPPVRAQAPVNPDVWRSFAQQVAVGSRIKLRVREGERVTVTLVQAGPDRLLVQPVTRVPVPVQEVPYDQIVSIERADGRGIGAAKAAAIGVAAGVGTFFGLMLIFVAAALD